MQMDAPMTEMQANMTAMQSQMDQIHATTDPKERQKLMRAHMQSMLDSMAMMQTIMEQMLQHQHRPVPVDRRRDLLAATGR